MRCWAAVTLAFAGLLAGASAFAPPPASHLAHKRTQQQAVATAAPPAAPLRSTTNDDDSQHTTGPAANAAATAAHQLAPLALGLAAAAAFATPAWAEAPEWVGPTRAALDPVLLYLEFAFLCRIVLSWYPSINLNKPPQNLVAWPTEPLLKPTRAVVPPAFGVDISPIVWVMILSFAREVLFGQQGIFTLLAQQ